MSKDKEDPTQRYEALLFKSPDRWETIRIGEAGHVQLGRQKSPGNRSDKFPTPYVRAGNITWRGLSLEDTLEMEFTPRERETFQLHPGDLLLSEASGSASEVGKPAIWPEGMGLFCFQNTVVRFRSKILNSRYSVHLFTAYAQRGVFAAQSLGVGIHHLSAKRFSELFVPVPPQKEQERIADRIEELFTDLDTGVAALVRVQKKLKRYRAALLHAAVTGRLTADWRAKHGDGGESGKQLLERILVARRQGWEDRTIRNYEFDDRTPPAGWEQRYREPEPPTVTTIRVLPPTWKLASHDQIGDVQLGRQRSPQHHSGDHMRPYVRVANVFEDEIRTHDVLEMNFTPKEFATYHLRRGDLLLNEGQSMELVGRPAMFRDEIEGCCFQNTLVRQRVFSGVDPSYALIVLRAQFKAGTYRKIAKITTSIAHLGADRFRRVEFPLPPVEEQKRIVDLVEERLSQIDAMETEVNRGLRRAARLRQAILKAAFEGKLVPQNAEDEPASELLARIQAEADAEVVAVAKRTPSKRKAAKKKSTKKASA